MHGRSRGNVMILGRESGCRAFLSLLFLSFPFSFLRLPLPFLLHFFGLSRASFPRSRDKTAQVGFRDKTEKADGVYLCTRDYFIVAHCDTRGI